MADTVTQVKRDYFWNTAASVMSAASSMLLLLVVTQFMGAYAGGIFSIAFATGWQFQTFGAFEMRLYQATDVEHHYSFDTYHASRIITVALMIVGIVGYALYDSGLTNEALLIVLVAFLRVFDAYEDVFHGEFQRRGRLDIGARAAFFRALTTAVVFSAMVALTRDLLIACVATIIASAIVLLALNIPPARRMYGLRPVFRFHELTKLLIACLPLAIGAFLAIYLTNAPRFGMKRYLRLEDVNDYAILFMPAMVINLLSGLAFKPLLTSLAKNWIAGNRPGFFATIRRGVLAIVVASGLVLVVSYLIGIPLLGFLYGIDLHGYRPDLMILIIGGAFNALNILIYYVLVTMRLQRSAMVGYAIAAVAITGLTALLIPGLGMLGACIAYTGATALLSVVWTIRITIALRNSRPSQTKGMHPDGVQEL